MFEHRAVDLQRDRETLLAFHCRINYESESPYARRATYEDYRRMWMRTPQPEAFLAHLAETMEDPRTLVEVVEDSTAAVGYLWVTFHDLPGYGVTIAEIMDLFVAPRYRRRGMGQGLMAYIEEEGRARGATLLRSDTGIDNIPSQRLHEKVGFQVYRVQYEKALSCERLPLGVGGREADPTAEEPEAIQGRRGRGDAVSVGGAGRWVETVAFHYLLHPYNTALVTCCDVRGRSNALAIAWLIPVSVRPPRVGMSISPARYSYGLIQATGEFVVNVAPYEIAEQVLFCGRRSGREMDKLAAVGLTVGQGRHVRPPVIEEAVAHLECRVQEDVPAGDHRFVIGEVVAAYARPGVLGDDGLYDLSRVQPLLHLGRNSFTSTRTTSTEPSLPPG